MSEVFGQLGSSRTADVASMGEAVLALRSLARRAAPAKGLPPLAFALRYGIAPPVLAGRAEETAILREVVAGIQERRGDQCLLGLYGIRGQGKTVLVRLLEETARQAGVCVVTLSAAGSGADFAQAIMAAESLARTTSAAAAREGAAGVNVALKAGVRSATTRQLAETRTARMSVDAALEHRRAQEHAILLVLDEAHNLRQEAAQSLFNAYQAQSVKGAALGLVFAGTPDLPDRLSELGVTFTERPGRHGRTPLGPISDANAAMAVLAPFAERGALPQGMAPRAPGEIVEGVANACCGYPYYTQLFGDALGQVWERDERPGVISGDHFKEATRLFATQRLRHYRTRSLELEKIGALECARNVAAALQSRGFITRAELWQCVSRGLRERRRLEEAGEAIREEDWLDGVWSARTGMAPALLHRGFLWSPEGGAGEEFQAGIHSLASHMLEATPPASRRDATA